MAEVNQWNLDLLKSNAKCVIFVKVGDKVHSVYISDSDNRHEVADIYELASFLTPRPTSIIIRPANAEDWAFIEKHYDDDLAAGIVNDSPTA